MLRHSTYICTRLAYCSCFTFISICSMMFLNWILFVRILLLFSYYNTIHNMDKINTIYKVIHLINFLFWSFFPFCFLSISFLLFLFGWLSSSLIKWIDIKHYEGKNHKIGETDRSHASIFLRIGSIVFGLGVMIYNGLEFGAYFEISPDSSCHSILLGKLKKIYVKTKKNEIQWHYLSSLRKRILIEKNENRKFNFPFQIC